MRDRRLTRRPSREEMRSGLEAPRDGIRRFAWAWWNGGFRRGVLGTENIEEGLMMRGEGVFALCGSEIVFYFRCPCADVDWVT